MGSTSMGGAQMFVLNLLKNLNLSRYKIDFAVNFEERKGGIGDELKDLGCNIYYLPYFKVYNYLSFVKAWRRFLQLHHYDIVHGHSTNSASIYLRIAKDMGCVTIAHCHSAGFRGGRLQQLLKRYFAKGIRHSADYLYACSEIAAEHLYGKEYRRFENYHNIPNAINADKYRYNDIIAKRIRNELNIGENVFLCGHVGSFTSPKNHDFLIDIFKEVVSVRPDARLLCCGAGPLMPQVKDKAKSLGLQDKIIFTGNVKNCNEYMMAMDVLIFPSLFEGFPVTVIEAEATGLPVVMSDVITSEVDITDCVHRLSLSDSPEKWAQVISISESKNRDNYNNLIANSKYNMPTSVKLIDSLYKNMIIK